MQRKESRKERRKQSAALAIMSFTGLISLTLLTIFAVLKVEGTAKGAVPLDTLTFDKVFLKIVVPLPRLLSIYNISLNPLRSGKYDDPTDTFCKSLSSTLQS